MSNVLGVTSARRWEFLDVLRGFALCGILFVNVPDLISLGSEASSIRSGPDPVSASYALWIQGRFVPIFAFLFGVSAALLYLSSLKRIAAGASRWLMVRRFSLLLFIGIVHWILLYPGEILSIYGVISLIFLVPVLSLPRKVVLIGGIVFLIAGYVAMGNNVLAAPGLMLTGWAAAQYGLPRALEYGGRRVGTVFAGSAILGASLTWWQSTFPGDPRAIAPGGELVIQVGGFAGLLLAIAYVTGLSLLWQTPARALLSTVFRSLGKMALTNYVGASLILFVLKLFIDFPKINDSFWLPVIAVSILMFQALVSTLWLRGFRYGPLEWLWRMGTRWEYVQLRKRQPETSSLKT